MTSDLYFVSGRMKGFESEDFYSCSPNVSTPISFIIDNLHFQEKKGLSGPGKLVIGMGQV